MRRYYVLIGFMFCAFLVKGQQQYEYIYYPQSSQVDDWRIKAQLYYDNHNNSNAFINEFATAINQSKYISSDLKDRQSSVLEPSIISGRTLKSGFDLWLNSKNKEKKLSYYFGLDFQQVLDSRIDEDMVNLLFYGNKPYAGENLNISNTDYMSIYFNRIKAGVSKSFGKGEVKHQLSGIVGFNFGQNYDAVQLKNSNFYTQEEGDYLDISIQAETQLADTVWGDVFTINGMGTSLDLHYSVHKEKDFYIGINIGNLGFVSWNKHPFVASADTAFRFSGLENDSTENPNIPNDFSYDNLRNIIFTNPNHQAFTELLPLDININAGKYLVDGKLYVGVNTVFYPTLIANYRAEIFATWNYLEVFQVTPIIGYNSYQQVNIGLAVGFELWDTMLVRAGSSYLNSMFNPNAKVGQGGFVSLGIHL